MLVDNISIVSVGSFTTLGTTQSQKWEALNEPKHNLILEFFDSKPCWVGKIRPKDLHLLQDLLASDRRLKYLDKSVLYAILSVKETLKHAHWNIKDSIGVNIGTSRGPTELLEKYITLHNQNRPLSPFVSPNTTWGNLSSWVAQTNDIKGPVFSHSITCSTGLHAVLNGITWLKSGFCKKFIVGATEAPLTAFTIAQMKALRVYSEDQKAKYPCKPLCLEKKQNTMVLGEGACSLALVEGKNSKAQAIIKSVGYATESLTHGASLSREGHCIEQAMKMALESLSCSDIDLIITHTPGTILGDLSEIQAIKAVFGDNVPFITNNKWKIGHTFATAGLLNIEMAILMIKYQKQIAIPYATQYQKELRKPINRVLVNAIGFGGNAVSIIIERP